MQNNQDKEKKTNLLVAAAQNQTPSEGTSEPDNKSSESEVKGHEKDKNSTNSAIETPNPQSKPNTLLTKRKRCPLLEGCNSIDNYLHMNKIHEGVYGVVFRAQEKSSGEVYAIKKVKMGKEKEGFPITSIREINLLLSLKHPNIVNVREVVIGSSLDKTYVVMEYIEHELKDLMEYTGYQFRQSEVKLLVKQLLQAVEYLHNKFVIHRDLKTSNLLYSNKGILKVCDLGLARKYVSSNKSYTPVVVTLWYRAPEILLGCDKYTPAIDIWSVGCIFAELVLKEPLLRGQSETEQIGLIFQMLGTPNNTTWPGWKELKYARNINFKNHIGDKLSERFPKTTSTGDALISDSGIDLLRQMLTYDPNKRITATKALKHPWFEEMPPAQDQELMPTFPPMNEIPREMRKAKKAV